MDKVEVEVVQKSDRQTRALQPRRMRVTEAWAEAIERVSKGKIRRSVINNEDLIKKAPRKAPRKSSPRKAPRKSSPR